MKPTKERVWVIAESEEELGIAQIERIEESPAITRWRVRAEKAEAELGNFCLYVRDYSNDSHIVARAKTIIKHLDEKEKP